MLGRIGNTLGCLVLNGLRGAVVPVRCAKCGFEFKPFEGHTFMRVGEIMERFPCPHCGHEFGLGEDAKSKRDESAFNPPGPHQKPEKTRIERSEPTPDSLLFFIPPGKRCGVLLPMGILWSLFTVPFCYYLLFVGHGVPVAPKIFMGVFAAVGLGLVYSALRQMFSSHLVYLSPELVRVQRRLLFRATQDVRPEVVKHVKLTQFYAENETPVHGIEIMAGRRPVRFGSALTEKEKLWLAWEIRQFLRQHGAPELPPEDA